MPARSARCEIVVRSRDFLPPLLLLVAVPAGVAADAAAYWIEARPRSAAEADLLAAAGSKEGPVARADALRRLSEQHPGTPVSGLARLAAGLLLLEHGKPADALESLRHPDVARTALAERGALATARALDETKDLAGAAERYLAAAGARGDGPVACAAELAASDVLRRDGRKDEAIAVAQRALAGCPRQRGEALLTLARAYDAKGSDKDAALAFDQLDRELPLSAEAHEAAPRRKALQAQLPPPAPEERAARALHKALALFDAGRNGEAIPALRAVPLAALSKEEAELVRVRLGRALLGAGKLRDAELALAAIKPGSALEAEAAYHLAKIQDKRSDNVSGYEAVATRFAGSEWAEEALFALASHHQTDRRQEDATRYFKRLIEAHPEGRYVDRAAWRAGWGEYGAGRYEQAAAIMEGAARQRPRANVTPALLYWSGRARQQLGQAERARALLAETLARYAHLYHGIRAREALQQLPGGPHAPSLDAATTALAPREPLAAADGERVRQLLLIARWDEAESELRVLPSSALVQGTIAWLEWKRGRLRPAITAMKRAYPEYMGERGEQLPVEAWRILYPLDYEEVLRGKAVEEGLDPALVAALVCQESTFDPDAVSVAGARGLMQIMPPTGRSLARRFGITYKRQVLHQPETSLDFGTHYLRGLMDRYAGRVERALAAYNAGPSRVDAWTAGRRDMPAEEFIESIPFSETRLYVMTILAAQEQYRRIYGLSAENRTASASAR
jgi:soluble lytic murein transglycosylase